MQISETTFVSMVWILLIYLGVSNIVLLVLMFKEFFGKKKIKQSV